MPVYLRKNFGYGYLASSITGLSSQITLSAGHTLPTSAGSSVVIIWDSSYVSPNQDANMEIVLAVYSGTPNIYNITRAQESTLAAAHSSDSRVVMAMTAGVSSADLYVVGSKVIDESAIGNNKFIYYDSSSGTLKYIALPGGGDMLKSIYDPTNSGTALSDHKVLADVTDPTADYLSGKVENSIAEDSSNHKIQLSGDTAVPGNSQYYGTGTTGTRGWYSQSPQIFTSNGTFTAPSNVTIVYVTLVGGGGGGANTRDASNGGSGGGAGASMFRRPYSVTPAGNYAVVVGTAGSGAAAGGGVALAGGNGNASSFNSDLTVNGGQGGQVSAIGAGGVFTNTLGTTTTGVGGVMAGQGISGGGGAIYGASGAPDYSGGGGGSFIGIGGAGGLAGHAGSNGTGYGSGGGGAGSGSVALYKGGDGKLGIVIVEW